MNVMNGSVGMWRWALASLLIWCAASGQARATFANGIDFQADTVGGNPGAADYIEETGGSVVEVIGASSTPADPFGGAGNKSLWLQDDSATGSAQAGFRRTTTEAVGWLGLKFNVTQDATYPTPFFQVRLFDDGVTSLDGSASTAEMGPWMAFNASLAGDPIDIRVADTVGGWLILDQTLTSNTVHTLVITFNAASDTFTALLDGSPLTDDGGTTTAFPFRTPQSGIDAIEFTAAHYTRTGAQAFVDDIQLVPEPNVTALLAVAGAVLWRRRKKAE